MKIAVCSLLLLATLVECRFMTRSSSRRIEMNFQKVSPDVCNDLESSNPRAFSACQMLTTSGKVSCYMVEGMLDSIDEYTAMASKLVFEDACRTSEDGPVDVTCGKSPALRRKEPLMSGGAMGRIVGGEETTDCSVVPWQVRIWASMWLCGGSVITKNHILTAAHCFTNINFNPLRVTVIVADHSIDKDDPEEKYFYVDKIEVHEQYNATSKENDIAILHLTKPLNYRRCVTPICLDADFTPNGDYCIVAGWGTTKFKGSHSDVLKMAKVKAHKGSDCREKFGIWRENYFRNTTTQLCAGYPTGGTDPCQGDSGGPLVCWKDGRYLQTGLVSYGDACGWPNAPTLYTNVPFFYDWIQKKIKS